ncbi:MAG: hypothetical protein RBT03_04985, partial [Kiritimatiellia bacterium]|nr:hypothetical protein [Kiritimatiellia bacterium]
LPPIPLCSPPPSARACRIHPPPAADAPRSATPPVPRLIPRVRLPHARPSPSEADDPVFW